MKSSTIRRSNLSKEKMAVLEALSKYRQDSYDNTPNVYVRPNKEKELDVLWQNFKLSQKNEKSPSVYLATGCCRCACNAYACRFGKSFQSRSFC